MSSNLEDVSPPLGVSSVPTTEPSSSPATNEATSTTTNTTSTTTTTSKIATTQLNKTQPVSQKTHPLVALSYVTIAVLWAASPFVSIPYVPHLLVLVTAILYAACHASLVLLPHYHMHTVEGSKGEAAPEFETLRTEDAYQFPIVGSVSLFSLYLAFKYLDKDMVNLLIGLYFGAVGCLALTVTLTDGVAKLLPISSFRRQVKWSKSIPHSLPKFIAGPSPFEIKIGFNGHDAIAFIISAVVCGLYYYLGKPWYLNNILGISFCLQGIGRFSLGTYKIGAILLLGLFFYDIFWVFGTDVMVTVAKNLDGPIKILFPRSLDRDPETNKIHLSLLGLGDIVIPGFFLALLLRFDAHRVNAHSNFFSKPYFHTALIAYVAGLGLTLYIMTAFKAAQPALLYLVPACLGSSFCTALFRGEVKQLLDYTEEEEVTEDSEGETKVKEAALKLEAKIQDAKKNE